MNYLKIILKNFNNTDVGLLIMRITFGCLMYYNHGHAKLFGGVDRWYGLGGALTVAGQLPLAPRLSCWYEPQPLFVCTSFENSLQILLANTSHTGLPRTHGAPTRAAHGPHTTRARLKHALSPVPGDARPDCVTYVAPHPAPCHRWPQMALEAHGGQPGRGRCEPEHTSRTST